MAQAKVVRYGILVTPETGLHLRALKNVEEQLATYCLIHNINPENLSDD